VSPLMWWIDDERIVDFAFLGGSQKVFTVRTVGLDRIEEHVETKHSRQGPGPVFEELPIVHLGDSLFAETFFDDFDVLSLRERKQQHEIADHDDRSDGEFKRTEAVIKS